MTAPEVFHGISDEEFINQKEFAPRSEVVGWTQGFHDKEKGFVTSHGRSLSVTGLVVGREMRGVVTNEEGELTIKVQTYVKVTGNEFPLSLLKDAKPHEGGTGKEFEITENLTPEHAFKLEYSQTKPTTVSEKAAQILIPLVPTLLMKTDTIKKDYFETENGALSEETIRLLLPLIPTLLATREGSSDTQGPHTALPAHQV